MIGMHWCADQAGSFQLNHFGTKKDQILDQLLEIWLMDVLHFY
jgi:hypothetical protein